MEEFHCAATMDDDQEGEWREILQKWDEHTGFAAAAAHPSDDDHGLTGMGSSMQQPTCTSMLNVHSSLAMESLHPIFMSPNPNSNGLTSPTGLGHSFIHSPHSLISLSMHQPNSTSASLEAAVIDQLNNSAANLSTIDAENLISTVRQQEESADNTRSSWFSVFLQSLQAHPGGAPTGLASSSASHSNLINLGVDDNQQGVEAAVAHSNVNLYSNPRGLDEMMEHMADNDFINFYGGAAPSLQEQLSNALSASDIMRSSTAALKESERAGTSMMGSGNERGITGQTLLCTPASSVSSDGGPEDDSDSHEDMKDSLDMATSLDAFDDLILPGEHSQLNAPSSIPSPDTLSSKAAVKAQGETSAAPSSSHDHDKKRASKSARVSKKPKRERGAKLAIKIQSDVEVLDDGYKWRKYGQKAVKNSPYPRSYYKCTDKQCKVKKHVERQAHEPDYVVTTYEGVHNHSRPDQQVQVLHSQSDVASQQHDSFQAFVPTPSTHHLSPMELFGLRSSPLFQADSQPMSLPSQQATLSTQQTLEGIDQGTLQNLLHGEPRRSSN